MSIRPSRFVFSAIPELSKIFKWTWIVLQIPLESDGFVQFSCELLSSRSLIRRIRSGSASDELSSRIFMTRGERAGHELMKWAKKTKKSTANWELIKNANAKKFWFRVWMPLEAMRDGKIGWWNEILEKNTWATASRPRRQRLHKFIMQNIRR